MSRAAPRRGRRSRGTQVRLALLTSDYNGEITSKMLEDARREAVRSRARVARSVHVPGVFDMPLVARALLRQKDVDALVVLGAVVTGETDHDDLITHQATRMLLDLSIRAKKPLGFGITGPGQTREQALARVDRAGAAVRAAVKLVDTLRQV